MAQPKPAAPPAVDPHSLPRFVRDAVDMYFPRGISARSAHYYIQAEYVRLLRGRAQAERNADRWQRTLAELERALPDLSVRDATCYVSDNCYQADVLLHAGYELPDRPSDLLGTFRRGVRIASIHASFLAPAWWMGVRKFCRNGARGARAEWEWPQRSPAQKVRLVAEEVLGTLGWQRLSNDQVRQRVEDVLLRSIPQEARVGHILFSELIEFP